jgi:hypothetical protein
MWKAERTLPVESSSKGSAEREGGANLDSRDGGWSRPRQRREWAEATSSIDMEYRGHSSVKNLG